MALPSSVPRQITAAPAIVAGQATLQGTSKAQLSNTNMPTQTMPAQSLPDQRQAKYRRRHYGRVVPQPIPA